MKKMILKIKRRIYYRRLLRLYCKGMRIQNNLKEWGCDYFTCYNCPYDKGSNVCGIKSEMSIWSQNMDKTLYKYQEYELKLELIKGKKTPWLIDSIEINSDGQIVKDSFNNKLGGAKNEQKTQNETIQTRQE